MTTQYFILTVQFNGKSYTGRGCPNKTLLENIEDMSLPIRSSCRRGRCGSCRVQLVNGELDSDKFSIEDGELLSCTTYITQDTEVAVSYGQKITRRRKVVAELA
ncbi:2Fe-2S iron-sulfur cluster-binding protein [Aliikangiella coralliicola]|uniref:2Fe-2S iron-sulfur cluster binding domain-containing protein n=1 Tax=Aliikangiella coralliicola TaxID=2592383 RepID=A0A545U671_9GAMM|nr:2Fe-2S iron-sulfur cluster binding domain-containing protein [Aliikangiella coralliicola]TQV84969.1 2Fe-2S iron-sulfur cluster binding domain-containing protein [Aliikangiella coralliicola]